MQTLHRLAPFILALAPLLGCRQIAGIEDIQLTGDGGATTDGGTSKIETLVSATSGEAIATALEMFVKDGQVYVVTESSIWRCAITGCTTPEVVVPSFAGLASDAVLVGSEIYFSTNENGGSIRAVGLDGKNLRVFGLAPKVEGVGSDGTQIFWATHPDPNPGQILRCAIGTTCASPTVVIDALDQVVDSFAMVVVFGGQVFTNVTNSGSAIEKLVSCGTTATCGASPKPTAITSDFFAHNYFYETPTRLLYNDGTNLAYFDPTLKDVVVASSKSLGGLWTSADDRAIVSDNVNGDGILSAPLAGPPQVSTVVPAQTDTIDTGVASNGFVYFVISSAGAKLYRAPIP
jgi:hypothetical protein